MFKYFSSKDRAGWLCVYTLLVAVSFNIPDEYTYFFRCAVHAMTMVYAFAHSINSSSAEARLVFKSCVATGTLGNKVLIIKNITHWNFIDFVCSDGRAATLIRTAYSNGGCINHDVYGQVLNALFRDLQKFRKVQSSIRFYDSSSFCSKLKSKDWASHWTGRAWRRSAWNPISLCICNGYNHLVITNKKNFSYFLKGMTYFYWKFNRD